MECPRIPRSRSRDHAVHLREELKLMPRRLVRTVKDAGFDFYLCGGRATGRFMGLPAFPDVTDDGRDYAVTSHVCPNQRRVYLYETVAREDGFSVVHHEFAHALDFALGSPSLKHFRGTPLDWYAALNPRERFAQAFCAYFMPDRSPTPWYAVHTQQELRQKEPDLYAYLSGLMQ